jgi:prepilin signal peptidase PulO-like enzyme (type II secretory pathway)
MTNGFIYYMAFSGALLGPLLARWVQVAPLWMQAHCESSDHHNLESQPKWSLRGSCIMATASSAIWLVCAYVWEGPAAIAWALFGSGLLLLACIDALSGWLPDVFTLGLLVLGLLASAAQLHSTELFDAAWGGIFGFGVLWCTAKGFYALTGREGLGGGDPKLLAAIGVWMGWASVAPVLLVASLSGALFGAVMQGLGRWQPNQAFPFGPFLVLAVPVIGLSDHDSMTLWAK